MNCGTAVPSENRKQKSEITHSHFNRKSGAYLLSNRILHILRARTHTLSHLLRSNKREAPGIRRVTSSSSSPSAKLLPRAAFELQIPECLHVVVTAIEAHAGVGGNGEEPSLSDKDE